MQRRDTRDPYQATRLFANTVYIVTTASLYTRRTETPLDPDGHRYAPGKPPTLAKLLLGTKTANKDRFGDNRKVKTGIHRLRTFMISVIGWGDT